MTKLYPDKLRASLHHHGYNVWDRNDLSTDYSNWVKEFNGVFVAPVLGGMTFYVEFSNDEDATAFILRFP